MWHLVWYFKIAWLTPCWSSWVCIHPGAFVFLVHLVMQSQPFYHLSLSLLLSGPLVCPPPLFSAEIRPYLSTYLQHHVCLVLARMLSPTCSTSQVLLTSLISSLALLIPLFVFKASHLGSWRTGDWTAVTQLTSPVSTPPYLSGHLLSPFAVHIWGHHTKLLLPTATGFLVFLIA